MKPLVSAVAVLVALAAGVPMQAQTPEFDALLARAEQGDAEAQYEFGCMYDIGCVDETVLSNGLDLEIDALDDAEAVRWYRSAAEQGHADAQWNLGLMYEVGVGVPQDYVVAHVWLYLSASRRNSTDKILELVAHGRDRVAGKMNPDQFVEAQRLASEWDAAHPRR